MNPSILLAVYLLTAPCRADNPAPAPAAAAAPAVFNLKTAPADVKAKVDKLRMQFEIYGYRFDDDAGTIIAFKTKQPIATQEVEAVLSEMENGTKQMALARIADLLKGQDPAKPLTPDQIKILQDIAATNHQFLAPKILAGIEAAAKGPAGSLGADALAGYEELARTFDGKAPLSAFIGGAQPVSESWNHQPQLPAYFNDDERKLGEKVTAALTAQFQKSKTGRELLGYFTDAKGNVKLPDMLVLKIDDFASAVYSAPNRAVICNFEPLKQALLANAPIDRQQELQNRLKTPKDLNDYLAQDPKAIEAFIGIYDVPFYHELTHAWQDKRGTLQLERSRGNAPPTDPLEWEWEAFRNQNRYLHEKLLTDPDAAMRSVWIDNYRQMLADFPGWQDAIARQYMAGMPAGVATLPEMKELQNLRRAATVHEAPRTFSSIAKSFLKLVGLKLGDAALGADQAELAARTDQFKKDEYPAMRVDGFMALSDAYEKRLEYRDGFQAAVAAENFAKGTPQEKKASDAAQRLSDKALAWVRAGRGDPDSLAAALSAVTSRDAAQHKPPLAGQNDLVAATYLRAVDSHVANSRNSAVPEIKKRELASAQSYLDALKAFKPADVADPVLRRRLLDARALFPDGRP